MEQLVRATGPIPRTDKRFDSEAAAEFNESWYAAAREDFWTFRCMVRPRLIPGWWQNVVADQLTHFWHELKAGRRPKLVLGAPPQHGKSDLMRDFCCWAAGKDPDGKILFASAASQWTI